MRRLVVPVLACALLPSAAASAGPVVSAGSALDPYGASPAAFAGHGHDVLAAWATTRTTGFGPGLLVRPLGDDGLPSGRERIVSGERAAHPSLTALPGHRFLAAWVTYPLAEAVMARPLGRSGKPAGRRRQAIRFDRPVFTVGLAGSTGGGALLAVGMDDEAALRLVRLDRDARRVGKPRRLLAPAGFAGTDPPDVALAALRDGGYVLVASWEGALWAHRLDARGRPAGSPVAVTGTGGPGDVHPVLAAAPDGSGFLVTWHIVPAWGHVDVAARRLDRHGRPAGTTIGVATETGGFDPPAAAGGASGWVVAYERAVSSRYTQVYARELRASGAPTGPERKLTSAALGFGGAVRPRLVTIRRGLLTAGWIGLGPSSGPDQQLMMRTIRARAG